MDLKTLMSLPLHSEAKITKQLKVVRVPGGFMYVWCILETGAITSCFVPEPDGSKGPIGLKTLIPDYIADRLTNKQLEVVIASYMSPKVTIMKDGSQRIRQDIFKLNDKPVKRSKN